MSTKYFYHLQQINSANLEPLFYQRNDSFFFVSHLAMLESNLDKFPLNNTNNNTSLFAGV
jgi:hypothetical protein